MECKTFDLRVTNQSMSVTSRQLKQNLCQKTGERYLHNEEFCVTSLETETISGFRFYTNTNNFFFQNSKVILEQRSVVTV